MPIDIDKQFIPTSPVSWRKKKKTVDGPQQPLTIQEASEMLGVTKHTLRFWEKELEGIIVPLRTGGGQRRYTSDHIAVIEEIKRLRAKGLSLPDIKRVLQNENGMKYEDSTSQDIDFLAEQIAEVVRSAVYDFFNDQ